MSDDLWLKLARVIGLLGLGLLILSSVGGVSLATRTAQKMKFLKGQTFKYHRGISVAGAVLFLVHPIPLLLAHHTTGMSWQNIFLPFTAPKQGILIAWGTLAAYTLAIVTAAALALKALARRYWRAIHYGTYSCYFLGCCIRLQSLMSFTAVNHSESLSQISFCCCLEQSSRYRFHFGR